MTFFSSGRWQYTVVPVAGRCSNMGVQINIPRHFFVIEELSVWRDPNLGTSLNSVTYRSVVGGWSPVPKACLD
jgi:hypothetical protein